MLVTAPAWRRQESCAANLAISLAQAGKRVLLLDADLRKPRFMRFSKCLRSRVVELSRRHLEGQRGVCKSFVEGLGYAPRAGCRQTCGAAWFRSLRRVPAVAATAALRLVVVDSPPVMAVADSSIISHAVSGVLFASALTMTSRRAAAKAIDQLEGTQARFFGAVLNRADSRSQSLLLPSVLPA